MVNWKQMSFMMAAALLLTSWMQITALAGPLEDAQAASDNGDARTAMNILLPLAQQGNVEAQFEVGKLYNSDASYAKVLTELGRGNGYFGNQEQDNIEAAKWFKMAADQGHSRAQYDIATDYEVGKGVPKDLSEAMKWYQKSANQGDSWGQIALGDMYRDGRGIKKDYVQAYMWYSLASTSPDTPVANGARSECNLIASKMTPQQVKEAKHRIAVWKPIPTSK